MMRTPPPSRGPESGGQMKKWFVVLILGAAQFVMVLDSTVMNVSISAVVDDLDSSVTAMQSAITFYTLHDGRHDAARRQTRRHLGAPTRLVIGSIVYAIGSLMTAFSPEHDRAVPGLVRSSKASAPCS